MICHRHRRSLRGSGEPGRPEDKGTRVSPNAIVSGCTVQAAEREEEGKVPSWH